MPAAARGEVYGVLVEPSEEGRVARGDAPQVGAQAAARRGGDIAQQLVLGQGHRYETLRAEEPVGGVVPASWLLK